jgi:hypothetical protein
MDEIKLKTSFNVRMDYEAGKDIVMLQKDLAKRIRSMRPEQSALNQKTLEELKLTLTGMITWTK